MDLSSETKLKEIGTIDVMEIKIFGPAIR